MSSYTLFLTILLIALTLRQVSAARSLSARRVRGTPNTRSADKYDRSITTFSPEGRLLQLEYALIAAEERGRGLTICVECDGVVIFAFPSMDDDDEEVDDGKSGGDETPLPSMSPESKTTDLASSVSIDENEPDTKDDENEAVASLAQSQPSVSFAANTEHNPTHNTKVHRLSPTHLLLTSGLAGDSRMLASAFRRVVSSWTHITYGEVITTRELAKEMGKVRHSIGLQPGARVLGVVGMLIGLDDIDDLMQSTKDLGVEVRMYRSLPGGTMDRCNVCCTGGGADAAGNAVRKDAMETLQSLVSPNNGDEKELATSDNEERITSKEKKIQQIIEEVGRMVLKYHPDSKDKEESPEDSKSDKRHAVDIWLVRAVATERTEANEQVLNPHRYLGKALMETRYARRVALDQLAIAAQCLIEENVNI